jgi:hypothetical protein
MRNIFNYQSLIVLMLSGTLLLSGCGGSQAVHTEGQPPKNDSIKSQTASITEKDGVKTIHGNAVGTIVQEKGDLLIEGNIAANAHIIVKDGGLKVTGSVGKGAIVEQNGGAGSISIGQGVIVSGGNITVSGDSNITVNGNNVTCINGNCTVDGKPLNKGKSNFNGITILGNIEDGAQITGTSVKAQNIGHNTRIEGGNSVTADIVSSDSVLEAGNSVDVRTTEDNVTLDGGNSVDVKGNVGKSSHINAGNSVEIDGSIGSLSTIKAGNSIEAGHIGDGVNARAGNSIEAQSAAESAKTKAMNVTIGGKDLSPSPF